MRKPVFNIKKNYLPIYKKPDFISLKKIGYYKSPATKVLFSIFWIGTVIFVTSCKTCQCPAYTYIQEQKKEAIQGRNGTFRTDQAKNEHRKINIKYSI